MPKRTARQSLRKPRRQPVRRRPRAAAPPVKPAAPPPAETWFGIIIDGKRVPYTLPSVDDAATVGVGLREQGHKVAIYDQGTNRVVKRL